MTDLPTIQHRDGTALAHVDHGGEGPPVILIHGWGMRGTLFDRVVPALGPGHRVIVVDLRGHGDSDAPEQDYTIAGFADDVAWQMETLGVDEPVVVGHSMGGFVALELAARGLARAAAILESPIAAPSDARAAIQPVLYGLAGDQWREMATGLLNHLLGETFPAEERAALVASLLDIPQHVLLGSLTGNVGYQNVGAAGRVQCPILYVGTQTPYADLARFRDLCPQLVTGQLVGCGHYFPLEVPEQLNPMLLRFLSLLPSWGIAATPGTS